MRSCPIILEILNRSISVEEKAKQIYNFLNSKIRIPEESISINIIEKLLKVKPDSKDLFIDDLEDFIMFRCSESYRSAMFNFLRFNYPKNLYPNTMPLIPSQESLSSLYNEINAKTKTYLN